MHPKEFRRLLESQRGPTKTVHRPQPAVPATPASDVSHKLREGFQGLNSVLHGIDEKLAEHNRTSGVINDSIAGLPELVRELPHASRAGVELLGGISTAIEHQNQLSRELVGQVQTLADQVRQIPTAVARIAERLDRSEQDRERLDHSLQDVRRSVTDMQSESVRLQERTLVEFREALSRERSEVERQREADHEVMREMVQRTGKQSQMLGLLMGLLILCAAAAVAAVFLLN